MEFKRQIENLHKDIQDIEKFVLYLKDNHGISTLDIDLLKSKIQHLYEKLTQIQVAKSTPEIPLDLSEQEESQEKDFEIKEETPILAEEVESEKEVILDENKDPETILQPTSIEEETQDNSTSFEASHNEEIEQEPPQVTQKVSNKSKSPEVLADRFKDKKQFRNEHLKQDHKLKDLTSKYDDTALSDISKAIGVNDKFQYIKELFNGDSEDYASTINVLNQVSTISEAEQYLQEKYSWEKEDKLVQRLLSLTRRKLKT